MRIIALPTLLLAVAVSACDQSNQDLPFEPDPTFVARQSIGPDGGLISHPSGIAMEFPRNALERATTISIVTALAAFPGQPEGELLPGTHFIVYPSELQLNRPATIDLAVEADELTDAQRLRLGIASPGSATGIMTDGVSLDLTADILRGKTSNLGDMAAIVADNAVVIQPQEPPPLTGGFLDLFGGSSAREALLAASRTAAEGDTLEFSVQCGSSGEVPRCVDSGLITIWASQEIRDRLSGDLILLNPEVDGDLLFYDFVDGLPTKASGQLYASGVLRVQLGQAITSFFVDDEFTTNGPGGASDISVGDDEITFARTTEGTQTVEYSVGFVGEELQMILRGEKSLDFQTDEGSNIVATLYIDLLLTG